MHAVLINRLHKCAPQTRTGEGPPTASTNADRNVWSLRDLIWDFFLVNILSIKEKTSETWNDFQPLTFAAVSQVGIFLFVSSTSRATTCRRLFSTAYPANVGWYSSKVKFRKHRSHLLVVLRKHVISQNSDLPLDFQHETTKFSEKASMGVIPVLLWPIAL